MKYSYGFLFMWLLAVRSFAANYYVASTGNDTNNGLSPATAWRTVARVNQAMTANIFYGGDSLLFNRGDTFTGQITLNSNAAGTATRRFVIGVYGTGPKPILKGTTRVSGWVAETVNGLPMFTRIGWTQPLGHLFANNRQLLIARLPNTGYLAMTANGNQNTPSVVAAEFGQNPQWVGATIHVRTGNDAIDTRTVQGINGTTATLSASGLTFQPKAGWGYIMENKLAFLDQRGEWFYDPTAQKLFFFPPVGIDPTQSSTLIEGSTNDYGLVFYGTFDYVVIRDIDFRFQRKSGIFNYDFTNGQVLNCNFSGQGAAGIKIQGATGARNCLISGNTFRDQNNGALEIKCTNCTITGNDSRRNFLVPGYGVSSLIEGRAMAVTGGGNRIRYNRIDSSGYHGIVTLSLRDTMEYNVISNCGLTKNDLGGIYSWENFNIQNPDTVAGSNAFIRRNIIYNVGGNLAGTPATNGVIAHGIYLDDGCWRYRITENNVYNVNGAGIFVQSSQHTRIDGNLLYNNSDSQIRVNSKERTAAPLSVGTVIMDNTAISTRRESFPVWLSSSEPGHDPTGVLNRNRWYNPYNDYIARLQTTTTDQSYALFQWQQATNQDALSRASWYRSTGWENIAFVSPNQKPNPNFNTDLSNWNTGPWTNSTRQWLSGAPFDGGYASISRIATTDQFMVEGRDLPSFSASTLYHISFSASASADLSNMTIWGRKQDCCYDFYNDFSRKFPMRATRNEFSYVVSNTQTFAGLAMVQFLMPSTVTSFNLDNVAVRQITASPEVPTQRAVLFTNPTNIPLAVALTGSLKWFTTDRVEIKTGTLTLPAYSGQVLYNLVSDGLYTVRAGNWDDPSNWSCVCVPVVGDAVQINHVMLMPTGYAGKAQKVTYGQQGGLQLQTGARLQLGQ